MFIEILMKSFFICYLQFLQNFTFKDRHSIKIFLHKIIGHKSTFFTANTEETFL